MCVLEGDGPGSFDLFFAQDLTSPGTYYGVSGRGSLTITDLSVAATPEPSSLALLGTGVVGVARMLRRRFV